MDNPNPKRQSMRVLIRPPVQIPPPSPPRTPPDPSPAPPQTSQNGVVVVGFIGKRHGDVTQLINRIIDANVFASGNFDTPFRIEKQEILNEEMEEWFKFRSISFYYDEENGILYLQFSSISCPVMEGFLESKMGFNSVLEDREFGDLQGMLFVFSVCHIVIYIQEGSRFDTQVFKRFRVLQAAKHAMTSNLKSRSPRPSTSNAHASSTSRMPSTGASSNNPSPGRGRGIFNRNASSVTLMHGLGSYSSLLPEQCTPVILFVFLDDFTNANPTSSSQEQVETSSLRSSIMPKPSLPAKGSGSVVMLARPVNKLEGGLRKKLQSSLESQVRLLIKRGRILSSSETGQTGSRSGGTSSSVPLFLLDSSRAVELVDLASNQAGESLVFATGLVEDVLDGKSTSDSFLLESNCQNANKDDINSVKEFIFRQSDILRGRGGLVSGTSSGSAAVVGMVAVAAAAAAASAASGKTYSSPELLSFETWLSSSQPILHGILSAKHGGIDEAEITKRKPHRQNGVLVPVEGNASKATDHIQLAIAFLQSGGGLNSKFSTLWCEKVLPIAKEIYLNELPPSYPTSQHEAHLERALVAFNSMVKGPAVQLYMKKLEDECLSIWSSGRQLCDAVSLTGKPCMHKRHDIETHGLLSSNEIKSHSSGYVFLNACACGRSRQLREDPFDFEGANATFNCFPECDKLLPALELPQGSVKGFMKYLSWTLKRIGGARYYNPAKGLLQSGFCTSQKYLLKWTISIGKVRNSNALPLSDGQQDSGNKLHNSSKDDSIAGTDMTKAVDAPFHSGEVQNVVEIQKRHSSNNIKSDDKTFSSGRGISNSAMRKPFSEVVAGSAGAYSGFPPLQMRKKPLPGTDKIIKYHSIEDQDLEKVKEPANNLEYQKVQDISAIDGTINGNATNGDSCSDGNPVFQIGSNVVPMNMNTGAVLKGFTSLKQVTMYVGFEHECPHGHRFILSLDHLNELGSPYTMPEESVVFSSTENSDQKAYHSKFGKNSGHTKAHRQSNGVINTALHKARNRDKSKAIDSIANMYVDGPLQISSPSEEQKNDAKLASMRDHETSLQSVCLDDGGYAFNLLNQSLPIYMNCPHCRDSKSKKDTTTVKFAGTISQLQRMFLVTPSFPVTVAACPVVQFEESCLHPAIPDRKEKLQFSLGCRVILPPDSFLSLRLPFVYGVKLEDGNLHPLTPFEHQPELTAWIMKGTTLQVVSEESNFEER